MGKKTKKLEPSAQTLFNNPQLSDVKLLLTHEGTTEEYQAHHAVLCGESGFFRKAFTGNFKEAKEPTMSLHDDDPALFKVLLEFVYTREYDSTEVEKFSTKLGKDTEAVLTVIHLYTMADKYDMPRLCKEATGHFEPLVGTLKKGVLNWEKIVKEYYNVKRKVDSDMARAIASALSNEKGFMMGTSSEHLIITLPEFATDIVLQARRSGVNIWLDVWGV